MMITDYTNIAKQANPPYNNVYPVVLSAIQFDKKPTAYQRLHDELNGTESTYLNLIELLEAVTKGQTFKNGIHAKPSEQYHGYKLTKEEESFLQQQELNGIDYMKAVRLMKQQKIKNDLKESGIKDTPEFVETDLAVLDVDDVLGQIEPIEIMKRTGAVALYYTFSHETNSPINTKMFRYRLLFDLSEMIQGKELLEKVQQEIKDGILKQYPHLHTQKIKNKSHGIDNITKMFYGSNRNYEVNENYKTYDVSNAITDFEKEQEFNQLANKLTRLSSSNASTTEAEILDIAQFLGDLNNEISHDEWITLAIGLWNTAQFEAFDDDVVIEALQMLDGNGQSNQYYLNLKQPLNSRGKQASAGTLIQLARDRGYKRKFAQQPTDEVEQAPQIATSTHTIEKYIQKDDMLNLLSNSDKRILVHSSTNTGKTRASVEASKAYLQQHKKAFVYIALPTRALSQQVVEDYDLNQAIMGSVNVQTVINKAIYDNSRLLVGTYDKAEIVHSLLSNYNVIIIADEVQKEVSSYNFRHEAIQTLFDLEVDKFIGLTGTPSEIDLTNYDCLEVFELKQEKVLSDKLQFIKYSNANAYDKLVAQVIELEVKNKNQKVLAFIENTRMINKLASALRKQGLKVATVAAEKNLSKSRTYMSILKNQSFDSDTQVVLTTSVLADGININNTKDYVCIIAPSHYKNVNFFNIDMIRQASNRFRNQYNKIIVPLYINKNLIQENVHDDYKYRLTTKAYPLINRYNKLLGSAELAKALLQIDFKEKFDEFIPSTAEHLSGLFRPREADGFNFELAYQNKQLAQQGLNHDERLLIELEQLESKIWAIDKRAIRQQASEDKEDYYSMRPYAFREAIKQALNVLEVIDIEAHEYFIQMNATHEIAKIVDELTKLEVQTEREKRDNVKIILHELIYTKLQRDYFETGRVNESGNEWKLLKDKMNNGHYNALTKLIQFMEYKEAIQELEYIQKNAQMYELISNFEAIQELNQYESTDSKTITEMIFKNIEDNIINESYLSKKELDEHIEELAKDFKIKGRYTIAKRQRLFKQVFKRFFITASSKPKKIDGRVRRQTDYKVIELADVADRRNVPVEEVQTLYEKYLYKK